MFWRTGATLIPALVSLMLARNLVAQSPCPTGELRAYSHNDYHRKQPLFDAVALGYNGVEVDVFLVDGTLRVGHDRKAARKGPALDSAYLQPLRELMDGCRALPRNGKTATSRFLLNIEIKEGSQDSYRALTRDLAKIRDIQATPADSSSAQSRVIVTLVGFAGVPGEPRDSKLGVSCKIERIDTPPPCLTDNRVTMLSIDYGKTMGRWWTLDSQWYHSLQRLTAMKRSHPHLLLRVYNLPVDASVYERLYQAGVDVLGIKLLEKSREARLHQH